MNIKRLTLYTTFCLTLLSLTAQAEFTVAKIFGDNMVLQRNEPIVIWGWGTAGEELRITFDGHAAKTTVTNDGFWRTELPAKTAGGPFTLDIEGSSSVHFENIMMGDVWLCSGQSNMQWNLSQTQYEETDLEFLKENNVRMFTVQIAWDCLPADDVAGGQWQNLSEENIQFFSAVAYQFGKALYKDIDVPIGLINSSLGATSIETWMSNEALMEFEQFQPDIAPVLEHGMNHEAMRSEFEKIRTDWEQEYYLTGPGIEGEWQLPDTDRSDWGEVEVPAYWDAYGLADHDGAVWYSTEFDLPDGFDSENYMLQLNQIRDYDIAWVNGIKIGETYGRHSHRTYTVSADILQPRNNVLVVRAFDTGGPGGFTTSAFWGNPLLLGSWKFKKGLSIDAAAFPQVIMPNVSPFSSPGVLFNSNIAPLTDLPIKGAIWYQGESNEARAHEYDKLLPAMIEDWRARWGSDFPFLIVQLANHLQPDMLPSESSWAELREAQYNALKLPLTGIACAIDIGETNDIHPQNKEDVGKRLALSAAKVAYGKDIVHSGPTMLAINFLNDETQIFFENVGDQLVTDHPDNLLSGFAVADESGEYVWADAYIKNNNTVVIPNVNDLKPRMIRYAWADNPLNANLYNSEGLPALPFRTDTLPGETYGKKYNYKDDRF